MTSPRRRKPAVASAPLLTLDNLTLARKEGWKSMVDAPRRIQPVLHSRAELKAMDGEARIEYDRQRRIWHANLGPIRTPQLDALHEDLWDIVDSNEQDGDKAKGAIAIDAFPGLGKTTSALAFAKKFHRRQVSEGGQMTAAGHERLPVCRVGLSGNTGMKDFNRGILEFFGHPAASRGTTAQFGDRALDCVLSCETKLLIVDELHFLRWRDRNGLEVSNHFKHIANEFPVTLLLIGVGLGKRGLFDEGDDYKDAVLAQTGRRTTKLGMDPFEITTQGGREAWRQILLAIEERLVLADKHPGMLADDLPDYLFARSTGHIGSLMTLINRGCQRAVRSGEETLSAGLLDRVKNDEASERARQEMENAMTSGRLTAKPSCRPRKGVRAARRSTR